MGRARKDRQRRLTCSARNMRRHPKGHPHIEGGQGYGLRGRVGKGRFMVNSWVLSVARLYFGSQHAEFALTVGNRYPAMEAKRLLNNEFAVKCSRVRLG